MTCMLVNVSYYYFRDQSDQFGNRTPSTLDLSFWSKMLLGVRIIKPITLFDFLMRSNARQKK